MIIDPSDLEEQSLDPVIERTCAECGAKLTTQEIRASLDAGGLQLGAGLRWELDGPR